MELVTRQPLYDQPAAKNDSLSVSLEASKKRAAATPVDPVIALQQEIDIMRSLRHPNIVALHEVCS